MPTKTNSLESTQGHLNAKTPRRNPLWQSLFRISLAMQTKSKSLWSCVQNNFANEVRELFTRSMKLDRTLMQQEVDWYQTTSISCNCGETIHLSSMYRVTMPCSHQYFLRVVKPSLPQIFNVSFMDTWYSCILDIVKHERESSEATQKPIDYIKNLMTCNIKRFSGSKKKDDIRRYVEENFVMDIEFALGLPISVLGLISEGIQILKKLEFTTQTML
jgi:hypothetical protein